MTEGWTVVLPTSQVMYYLCLVGLSTSLGSPEDMPPVVGIWACGRPLCGVLAVEGCLNSVAERAARQALAGTFLKEAAVWAEGFLRGGPVGGEGATPGGGQTRSSCWARLAAYPLWGYTVGLRGDPHA